MTKRRRSETPSPRPPRGQTKEPLTQETGQTPQPMMNENPYQAPLSGELSRSALHLWANFLLAVAILFSLTGPVAVAYLLTWLAWPMLESSLAFIGLGLLVCCTFFLLLWLSMTAKERAIETDNRKA
jgi:hypothetical protein